MKQLTLFVTLSFSVLSACTSLPSAPEPSGDWIKINSAAKKISVIPLESEYFYKVLIVDKTLSQVLERWASDSQLSYNFQCKNDFTITEKIFDFQVRSLSAGLAELMSIYSNFSIELSIAEDNKVLLFTCGKDTKEAYRKISQIKILSPVKNQFINISPEFKNESNIKMTTNTTDDDLELKKTIDINIR